VTVSNGREAVEAVMKGGFAAVLMDCQMPEMDGFQATGEIRCARPGRRIPIIAMTAAAMDGDREHCLGLEMDDYITKPVRLEALSTALATWVTAAATARAG